MEVCLASLEGFWVGLNQSLGDFANLINVGLVKEFAIFTLWNVRKRYWKVEDVNSSHQDLFGIFLIIRSPFKGIYSKSAKIDYGS